MIGEFETWADDEPAVAAKQNRIFRQIARGCLFWCSTLAELLTQDITDFTAHNPVLFPDEVVMVVTADRGGYWWDKDCLLVPDNEVIAKPDSMLNTDPGRWTLLLPMGDAIFAYTEPQTAVNGTLVETGSQVSTINPANIPANSSIDETVAMSGVLPGDEITITDPAALNAGVFTKGFCSTADQVIARFFNVTTGGINPGSGDYRITYRRYYP